jgi:hypothetical protein
MRHFLAFVALPFHSRRFYYYDNCITMGPDPAIANRTRIIKINVVAI